MIKRFKHFLIWYNLFSLCYVVIFSLVILFPNIDTKFIAKFVWVMIDDDTVVFIYIPLLVFVFQCFMKIKYQWLPSYSGIRLFLNMIIMSILCYIIFWMPFLMFVYKGEV